jgi:hypothetical protein
MQDTVVSGRVWSIVPISIGVQQNQDRLNKIGIDLDGSSKQNFLGHNT